MIKRVLDTVVSAAALVVTSPALAVVAVAIKATSPGPVLFTQERVGQYGRTFKIHKFRTMRPDHDGLAVSGTGDPRVTRIGAILRKTKLDEVPQFYDVLRGDMSLVGPRPEVPEYVAQWPTEMRPIILSVRPGITDPASIEFRNEGDELALARDPESHYVDSILPRKAAAYVDYVQRRSLVGDLKILGNTAKVVLFR
ncbi:sugar transferase [Citricoccus muralis]|uniref:Lipopolysaccharide/colanic/teichoic acid biosynthesis glycosyltransferase n=1 Tax=Citricoccus muralis TaxID=169134 RepID=A0A3D9LC96_9MICC|nr:sugar transferase [Citricoccus muralis]REE03782.1 lipopolysaccharide/colanic/teichoic acid biosynthesis glycosyltransferase [Citricoccus muralis]